MTRNLSPARTAQSLGGDSACPPKFGVLRVLRGLKFSVLLESAAILRMLFWNAYLVAESIVKCLDVHPEPFFDYILGLGRVVFRVMPQPWVGARVRKRFAYSKLFRDHNPVFPQTFESADEIGQHLAISVDKPIKLVAMRRGMDAGAATVLYPADKFFEAHLLSHLNRFVTFIK